MQLVAPYLEAVRVSRDWEASAVIDRSERPRPARHGGFDSLLGLGVKGGREAVGRSAMVPRSRVV